MSRRPPGLSKVLSCYDAANGKLLWRKENYRGNVPRFATSSSPIIVKGLCIAKLGGGNEGAIVAYDLTAGAETWKWTGDSPAYGSPVLMTVDGTQVLVTPTEQNMVAVSVAGGKPLWQVPFSQGRWKNCGSSEPLVADQF